ncbi:beta-ketoacyl-ACP synthase III [Periweissella ghanensis]|uniref:Beta-ketoacyl-[acyl-carrier-protein] synthase III n=1 Tax=Periweissella ghanensis TaxID=467997 RepID=A0ABN8BMK5_9LACO|nr:beta-ketoacyl-ACP synthase III [Periweissella ghanensis]MCM0600542.1 ketoacyl-ACP synthase III [Periweissella ghanensis]CAH0418248.1 3-oxoacyl-[acyl-carrier-protein] synthase 3 [Periweissella ghanensis]
MSDGVKIIAAGHYVPASVVDNHQLAAIMDTNDPWIQSHTGIKTRHFSLAGENTSDLATKAAQQALTNANYAAEDVDLIIVSTITPDAQTPATAAIVQKKLGAVNAWGYDISTACAGFVFALSTAEKFIKSGVYKSALVISAEVNTKMMDFTDRTSTVFFGDGAGAALLVADGDQSVIRAEKLQTMGDAETIHSGRVAPISAIKATNYPVTDAFYQSGRDVFEFATTKVPEQIASLLAANALSSDDIDFYIMHQANLRIIETIAENLGQPVAKFRENVSYYGNTSSAGIAMAFAELMNEQDLTGKRLLLTGFGAGLSYGSVILEF